MRIDIRWVRRASRKKASPMRYQQEQRHNSFTDSWKGAVSCTPDLVRPYLLAASVGA